MKSIVINDPVRLRNAIRFATQNGARNQIAHDMLYLIETLTNGMVLGSADETEPLKESPGDMIAEVTNDFAPHSLRFCIFTGARCYTQMARDFTVALNGGWVYAGPTSPGDGSFPSLSVNLSYLAGTAPTHAWSIHT